jgi:hypothetical protein
MTTVVRQNGLLVFENPFQANDGCGLWKRGAVNLMLVFGCFHCIQPRIKTDYIVENRHNTMVL